MITRQFLHPGVALRYSWKNIIYSSFCALLALAVNSQYISAPFMVPVSVVAILGTALAIILGFRNTSAYERWWEARKIWGGIVNESRTFTRQVLTIADPEEVSDDLRAACKQIVLGQIAWVNALKLQLRNILRDEKWLREVSCYLRQEEYDQVKNKNNRVTALGMQLGYAIKKLNAHNQMDTFSYIQMDDTLTRLTDLQGRAERIKNTPLPKPYDYYTLLFLNIFILFFPFAFVEIFIGYAAPWLLIPLTSIVGWIFYQIYVFGKVMSSPFENWKTDVALDAISNTIEIDLKQTINHNNIPAALHPKKGVLM